MTIPNIYNLQQINSIIQNLYIQFLQHVLLSVDTSGNVLVLHHESDKCIYLALEAFSTMGTVTHRHQFLD